MINYLLERRLPQSSVEHEYRSREFSHAFASWRETGDPHWRAEICKLIDECPHDIIVGNGYAPILPIFAQRCDPQLKLLHLRRADRSAAIKSLMRNCELFPAAYGHYSDDPGVHAKRMAAFHFGGVAEDAWRSLPLADKISWYFDKTHSLIHEHSGLFNARVILETERLNDLDARQMLAKLVVGDAQVLPPPTRLNAHVDDSWLPRERRHKMQWLMGRLNAYQAAHDDVYPLDYFADKFVAWTGYQIARTPQIGPEDYKAPAEIAATLERAEHILEKRLHDVKGLKQVLAQQSQPDPPGEDWARIVSAGKRSGKKWMMIALSILVTLMIVGLRVRDSH